MKLNFLKLKLKLEKIHARLERQPRQSITKIALIVFLFSCFLGYTLGYVQREIRVKTLLAKAQAQKGEEEKQLNNLMDKFSQMQTVSAKTKK
ncbi:MAG: hypothetical protein M1575_00605 [Patescibacteria group bacterium]|nr:hypothetical protein [Patescibacteria group bacterium]MCL5095227.1 hypothetical protein [Patescibacteria group bacterium]